MSASELTPHEYHGALRSLKLTRPPSNSSISNISPVHSPPATPPFSPTPTVSQLANDKAQDSISHMRLSSQGSVSMSTRSIPTRSRVLIIGTGGTFVMHRTAEGLVPQQGFLESFLLSDPDFDHPALPEWVIEEWDPLMDSANFSPTEWVAMADHVQRTYDDYDGFIILHGTDTMAYSASALSFMLENLNKPVVFTGAQIPIGEVFNDAKNNLLAALMVAGSLEICEVCLMFDTYLYRGCRATKIDPWHQHAFDSPNCLPLAQMGVDLEIEEGLFLRAPKRRFRVHREMFTDILVVWLVPGFSDVLLEAIVNCGKRVGLVLAFYGVGNGPNKEGFYKLLETAITEHQTEIVVLSQCQRGHVDSTRYGSGNFFADLNLMNGYDMTVEAAVAKLSYLMGMGKQGRELKILFEKDLRGEMTTTETLSKRVIRM